MITIKTYIVKVKMTDAERDSSWSTWVKELDGKEIEVVKLGTGFVPVEDFGRTDQINESIGAEHVGSWRWLTPSSVESIREVEAPPVPIAESREAITVEHGAEIERFEYALIEATALDALLVLTEPSAYITEDRITRALLDLLARGYRFCYQLKDDRALFERKYPRERVLKMVDALIAFVFAFDRMTAESPFYEISSEKHNQAMSAAREALRAYL